MQYVKHNKLKNTGILFELLVRQITADTLALREYSPAINILKKYLNSKTELGKELVLYRAFFNNTKPLSETKSLDLLSMVCQQRKKLNERTLKAEKYELISDIKQNYDLNEFLSVRVPFYKIYASIYKQFAMLEETVDILHIDQLSDSRFTIIEHLGGTIPKQAAVETSVAALWKQQDEDSRELVYRVLIEKFNHKYEMLSDKQKELLRLYINNASNIGILREHIQKEIVALSASINKKLPNLTNTILRVKLHEVLKQLERIGNVKQIKGHHMTGLLIAYEIDKELNNVQGVI